MEYFIEDLKIDLVNVTPDLARQLIDTCQYERQRPISEDHVTRLATEMANGRFIAGTTCHFAQVGRSLFLINGNHTLRAVIRAHVTLPLIFLYTECERMSDVDRLYARHDLHRARNWTATFRAHGMFEKIHADAQFVTAAGSAIRYILVGLDGSHDSGGPKAGRKAEAMWSRDLRVEAFREYATEVDLYAATLVKTTARSKRMLRRSPVIAIGMETMRFQPSKAAEFWYGIAQDDGLRNGDPRKALLEWTTENTGRGPTTTTGALRATSLAWNAFFEDRELSAIKVGLMQHYRLAGTPWKDGKRPELDCLKAKVAKTGLVKRAEAPPIIAATHIEIATETLPDGTKRAVAITSSNASSRPSP